MFLLERQRVALLNGYFIGESDGPLYLKHGPAPLVAVCRTNFPANPRGSARPSPYADVDLCVDLSREFRAPATGGALKRLEGVAFRRLLSLSNLWTAPRLRARGIWLPFRVFVENKGQIGFVRFFRFGFDGDPRFCIRAGLLESL
jgi:hypothetical protein